MSTFVKGDMWSQYLKTDLFLVTTNPVINARGELVMGRGIAKQMADKIPGSAYEFAHLIRLQPARNVNTMYYEPLFGKQTVGYFMVKSHWREKADVSIIMESTAELMRMAKNYNRIDLNFPGIGNGNLSRGEVLPIIAYLPDNVHIWEFEE